MFWRRKTLPAEPFVGSAFDTALRWCQDQGEQVTVRNRDAFDVQLGAHTVHVERFPDDDWLNAYTVLPEPPIEWGSTPTERVAVYEKFTQRQLKKLELILDLTLEGNLTARFTQLMRYQGSTHWMVFNMLAVFDYLLNEGDARITPAENIYFYVNGKRFVEAWEALDYYMYRVRKDSVIQDIKEYIAYDAGGMGCVIDKGTLSNEFCIRFGFSDFEELAKKQPHNPTPHLFAAAYRKYPSKTASYSFSTGISELAITGTLTEGTEARPIFTATLAAIYQTVLDSTERIKMNPKLVTGKQLLTSEEESIRQAARYQGDKTGGAEHLEKA